MKDSEVFEQTFDKFKALLDARKYSEVSSLIETYLNDETKSVGDLKTVLVITKSFKNHEIISANRKKLLELLESRLGSKLI